jgi:flagellar basal body-associated protein FliL
MPSTSRAPLESAHQSDDNVEAAPKTRRRAKMMWIGLASAAVIIVAAILTAIWVARRSSQWHRESLTQLELASRVITTPLGQIEYALIGTGRPILISHGILGGFDQCAVAAELLLAGC